ncbi:hypothetical protein ABPG74_012129 [Tetrahymena malaccensis]
MSIVLESHKLFNRFSKIELDSIQLRTVQRKVRDLDNNKGLQKLPQIREKIVATDEINDNSKVNNKYLNYHQNTRYLQMKLAVVLILIIQKCGLNRIFRYITLTKVSIKNSCVVVISQQGFNPLNLFEENLESDKYIKIPVENRELKQDFILGC